MTNSLRDFFSWQFSKVIYFLCKFLIIPSFRLANKLHLVIDSSLFSGRIFLLQTTEGTDGTEDTEGTEGADVNS